MRKNKLILNSSQMKISLNNKNVDEKGKLRRLKRNFLSDVKVRIMSVKFISGFLSYTLNPNSVSIVKQQIFVSVTVSLFAYLVKSEYSQLASWTYPRRFCRRERIPDLRNCHLQTSTNPSGDPKSPFSWLYKEIFLLRSNLTKSQ